MYSPSVLIENPGNNAKLLKVSIKIDDTEEEVYASNYLKPGTYIESVALDKVLEKGTYNATAYFLAYDETDGEFNRLPLAVPLRKTGEVLMENAIMLRSKTS